MYGLAYASKKYVFETGLCFKCYKRRAEFFPDHDHWEVRGTEFDPGSKEEEVEEDGAKEDEAEEDEVLQQPVESPSLVKQIEATEADYWSDTE